MLGQAQIAVVVPAYNEELHIAAVLRAIPRFVDRVIVVDDGSADGTAHIARAVHDARVQVLVHAHNRGVGAALKTGYRAAFDAGADVVAVMAGDGQMHPEDLLPLLAPVVRGLGILRNAVPTAEPVPAAFATLALDHNPDSN
jgi:glycosyltransferase involved in cell wall biosynthesis